jgi:type II secretory pathway pseudopilin PulG
MPSARPRAARRQAGVTYLMLLALVFLMGLGLAGVAAYWQTTAQREKEKELLFIGQQFRSALVSYAASAKQYPEALEQLLNDERSPTVRRHLRRIYADPLTGKADWGLIRRGGRIIGVYSLAPGSPLIRDGFPKELTDFARAEGYGDWRFQAEASVKAAADEDRGTAQPGASYPGTSQVPLTAPAGLGQDRRITVDGSASRCDAATGQAFERCSTRSYANDENSR